MSRENVEIVCGMLQDWAAGDREAARAAFDPNVVALLPIPDGGVSLGIPAMERALERWRADWVDWGFELQGAIDAGDHVIAFTRQWGTGKASGVRVELPNPGIYSLLNSRIIRVEIFETKAEEALEGAGLSEEQA